MSNIQPYIIINGVNSRTISGLLITSLPPISKPQQRTQVETVDGRSGDIITPLGFSAYDKTVSIGLTYNYDIDEVIEFFNTSGTVIFSNEPTKYYRFAIYEQIDFEKLIKFKTAEVVLHVQPYKFSTTEEPLLFNDPTEISVENNGNTDARPNLLITGSGEIDVSLNGSQLLSMDFDEDNQTIIIDSENMNAYGAQSAIREVVANIEPKQAGSGDPSPDNIREISGYSELNIDIGIDNFFNETTFSQGSIDAATGEELASPYRVRTDFIWLEEGEYLISSPNGFDIVANIYDENKSYKLSESYPTWTSTPRKISILSGGRYVRVLFRKPDNSSITPSEISGELLTKVLNTFTVVFTDGENPLTVYGGKLNVTTGELTITWSAVDLGSLNWIYESGAPRFYTFDTASYIKPASSQSAKGNILCSIYATKALSDIYSSADNIVCVSQSGVVSIKDTRFTNANDFKAAMDGIILAYELATPIVYQLTPTQINNLLGLNNLYSDTGDLSVKYKSGGVIQTQTGDIVTFTVGVGDMDKGTLLNRLVTGNYDKIRLKKGENVISFTGNVKQVSIDKYSRWI